MPKDEPFEMEPFTMLDKASGTFWLAGDNGDMKRWAQSEEGLAIRARGPRKARSAWDLGSSLELAMLADWPEWVALARKKIDDDANFVGKKKERAVWSALAMAMQNKAMPVAERLLSWQEAIGPSPIDKKPSDQELAFWEELPRAATPAFWAKAVGRPFFAQRLADALPWLPESMEGIKDKARHAEWVKKMCSAAQGLGAEGTEKAMAFALACWEADEPGSARAALRKALDAAVKATPNGDAKNAVWAAAASEAGRRWELDKLRWMAARGALNAPRAREAALEAALDLGEWSDARCREIVDFLGAEPIDWSQCWALGVAVRHGAQGAVDKLLELGAQINGPASKSKELQEPLVAAASSADLNGSSRLRWIQQLLAMGANPKGARGDGAPAKAAFAQGDLASLHALWAAGGLTPSLAQPLSQALGKKEPVAPAWPIPQGFTASRLGWSVALGAAALKTGGWKNETDFLECLLAETERDALLKAAKPARAGSRGASAASAQQGSPALAAKPSKKALRI